MDLAADEMQVLRDLAAGLAGTDDEHLARWDLVGIAIVLRMQLEEI